MCDLNQKQDEDFVIHVFQEEEGALIARSSAKRLLKPVIGYRRVVLDFSGISYIGQGFSDEIFRVFANEHPNIELIPINTNPDVQKMISRALHHNS